MGDRNSGPGVDVPEEALHAIRSQIVPVEEAGGDGLGAAEEIEVSDGLSRAIHGPTVTDRPDILGSASAADADLSTPPPHPTARPHYGTIMRSGRGANPVKDP
jgi:hypothetical protein